MIPVWQEVLADTDTPVSLYLKFGRTPYSYLLESIEGGERLGRYSFIGFDPLLVYRCRGDESALLREGREEKVSGTLDFLRRLLQELRVSPLPPGAPRFFGGLVGYFAYDVVRRLEKLPTNGKDDLQLPDIYLVLSRTLLIYDHLLRTVKVVCLARRGDRQDYEAAQARLQKVIGLMRENSPEHPPRSQDPDLISGPVTYRANMTAEEYKNKVRRIQEYIAAGDCIQVVLSRRLELPFRGDTFAVYRRLRTINPSPYMFYLNFPEVQLVGSSPEMLVRVEDGIIENRPIAGTRPRGRTAGEDRELAEDLQNSEKERAEHLMLLDLGRNDVGRVAVPGSVQVPQFMALENYSHVMHLVSRVTGRLAPGQNALDALLACFPAGTVSGAPKVRAMEIIAELEPNWRGPYAGAVGYLSLNGNMDTCIAIRTIAFTRGMAYVQAGAGIVADSEPEAEYEETMNKARGLLKSLGFGTSGEGT
ncbi:anthranilate synthase component I [Thermanaeromonas sp. C210]|uniref:anthranilate synthase component I n=1 Tax=Thermanaeromonas sp. C210 TaxID=2731925 RepID=UPI0015661437|nr:anthranilate synthase component I [Thermanaeromonas sp. C210]